MAQMSDAEKQRFYALRRRRNWAILGAIFFLCVVFFTMTIIRVKLGN